MKWCRNPSACRNTMALDGSHEAQADRHAERSATQTTRRMERRSVLRALERERCGDRRAGVGAVCPLKPGEDVERVHRRAVAVSLRDCGRTSARVWEALRASPHLQCEWCMPSAECEMLDWRGRARNLVEGSW